MQGLRVFLHHHIERLAVICDFHGRETDVRNGDDRPFLDSSQREITIEIGNGGVGGAFDGNRRANDRFAYSVLYNTLTSGILLYALHVVGSR